MKNVYKKMFVSLLTLLIVTLPFIATAQPKITNELSSELIKSEDLAINLPHT